MKKGYLYYPLVSGYIHNWLVAGPQATALQKQENLDRLQIAQYYYSPKPGITGTEHPRKKQAKCKPVENGTYLCQSIAGIDSSKTSGKWRYISTNHDHLIDLSTYYPLPHYLRAWVYTQIESPSKQKVTFAITANGPADVWINEQHVHRQEHFYHQFPKQVNFQADLETGINRLMVRLETITMDETPFGMALQLFDFETEKNKKAICIPTDSPDLLRRQQLEDLFDACHIRQDIYTHKEEIIVYLPENQAAAAAQFNIRLQKPNGPIYAEANRNKEYMGNQQSMGFPSQNPEGSYQLLFLPPPIEYYEKNLRVTHTRKFDAVNNIFSTQPYGTYKERCKECLQDAARRKNNIFGEIAKMALERWKDVNEETILTAIDSVNQQHDNSDSTLCGLLSILYHYTDQAQFPPTLQQPLKDCVLNFNYRQEKASINEPDDDESENILFHACKILAGQHYPEQTFPNIAQSGKQLCETGEQLALKWLQKRACYGFPKWDSHTYFEKYTLALSTLTSLAENQQIWELAALVMDKLFFTIAVNSFKGIFGSTRGQSYITDIKTGYREATSGITRLLWGMGIFNEHILGSVSIACSSYELPPILASIAADNPESLWCKEQHLTNGGNEAINKVTYKTPDGMLCSAQDWHAGKAGYQEHIWQATLSPKVTIFTSHPTCASENGAYRPNYWAGNAILPRVAQWKDILIALYDFAEDDWMGFTHAYFPVHGMDEHEIQEHWAFGKVGNGYIALAAANGLNFQTHGDNAYRELHSPGTPNTWLCQMGRAALDGSFREFIEKVLALPVKFKKKEIELTSLRGDQLRFSWQGTLQLNGESLLNNFKHYDNPYCACEMDAAIMEIHYTESMLRLHFDDEDAKAEN